MASCKAVSVGTVYIIARGPLAWPVDRGNRCYVRAIGFEKFDHALRLFVRARSSGLC